jgi:DNA-binding beta-propeller fold protein YncE
LRGGSTLTDVFDSSLQYVPVANWGALPLGFSFNGDGNAVAVDSNDLVYVFNRGPRPILIFDADGKLLGGWGDGQFDNPHSIRIDAADNLYLVDARPGHTVQKRSKDGELLLQIGSRGEPAERQSGKFFNAPTDVAIHPVTSEIFVSDGYGNSRIHRFSPEGEHSLSWGEIGSEPGQFYVPHSLAFLDDERLIVCDRENFRLQLFTVDGEFIEQWHSFRPSTLAVSADREHVFVGSIGPAPSYSDLPGLGRTVSVLSPKGELLQTLGSRVSGPGPDQFTAPHGMAIDSQRSLYVAEVSRTWLVNLMGEPPPLGEVISLRKWRLNVPARQQK